MRALLAALATLAAVVLYRVLTSGRTCQGVQDVWENGNGARP